MSKKELYDSFNSFLYKMCKEKFKHNNESIIYMKCFVIGRTYSVSPERYKNMHDSYKKDFWGKFCSSVKKSKIDKELKRLEDLEDKKTKTLNDEDKELVKSVFEAVHSIFSKACKVSKGHKFPNRVSFTSKYLHFHFPHLYYIYDSRAKKALKTSTSSYSTFYEKCHEELSKKKNKRLKTPRDLDNKLLKFKSF